MVYEKYQDKCRTLQDFVEAICKGYVGIDEASISPSILKPFDMEVTIKGTNNHVKAQYQFVIDVAEIINIPETLFYEILCREIETKLDACELFLKKKGGGLL